MKNQRIVVTNRIHAEVRERLNAIGEVIVNDDVEPWSPEALREHLREADAMIGFMTDRVDAGLLAAAPRLRIVACALKGYDAYDVDACTRAGVWISIVPDLLTAPTAELALGLAIGLARKLRDGDALMRNTVYRGWRSQLYGSGLDASTVGILGLGAVGRAIAQRLSGFGCARVLGHDPGVEAMPAGVEAVELACLLRDSDFLFLAAPLTASSIGLIDRHALEGARPGQSIINVGRGSVVVEDDIAEALEAGTIAGYAADVFACEDWGLAARPAHVHPALLGSSRTLLTPHLGSAVSRVRLAIEHCAVDNVIAALEGRVPLDAINHPLRLRPSLMAEAAMV